MKYTGELESYDPELYKRSVVSYEEERSRSDVTQGPPQKNVIPYESRRRLPPKAKTKPAQQRPREANPNGGAYNANRYSYTSNGYHDNSKSVRDRIPSMEHGEINHQSPGLYGSNVIDNTDEAAPSETKSLLQSNDNINLSKYDPSLYEPQSKYPYHSDKDRQSEINSFSQIALGEYPTYEASEEYHLSVYDYIFNFIYDDIYVKWIYNEKDPEFTEQQQIIWSIIIGILMGIYTALWSDLVEFCVEFVWKDVPEKLYELEIFTDLAGPRPLPHYMWVCPAIFGGVLSLITTLLPKEIPGQNEWIESLHRKGLMDSETWIYIFLISTGGMASGLSLGPELPLVLTAGMIGSYFAKITHQSVLSSRVLNLTAASAAIGGFFGFPMAGALFVLELPHKMGLQYHEALNPSVLASIFAVITSRIVTRNDVKGYFDYPFLKDVLPSHIFHIAILYGLVGAIFGVIYVKVGIKLKTVTHDLFHGHDHHDDHQEKHAIVENIHLPLSGTPRILNRKKKRDKKLSFVIHNEAVRTTIVGTLAGALVGVISMYYPHNLFWGEAQLQTLIDNGKTPLPVFGRGEEITADLTAYGRCMSNGESDFEFGIGCSAIFVVTKIIVIGLSLGTGIIGGHFWGPLYVGAAAGNLFNGVMSKFVDHFQFAYSLASYPCISMICIMGSTHVVTFKAHMAIILILTLTITSFNPSKTGLDIDGDYAAVFPLLVVSCFVSLFLTRGTVFYKKQQHRGDIIVSDQALCEPGQPGAPIVHEDEISESDGQEEDEHLDNSDHVNNIVVSNMNPDTMNNHQATRKIVETSITQDDIERQFAQVSNTSYVADTISNHSGRNRFPSTSSFSSNPPEQQHRAPPKHRRAHSDIVRDTIGKTDKFQRKIRADSTGSERSSSGKAYYRRDSFGEISDEDMQLPLLDQARARAASRDTDVSNSSSRPRVPRSHSHRRNHSLGSDFGKTANF